ncbi:MAG: YggU family protein [Syntrophus sp. (in: bacteria)]|nr:YggU family protein [Syntrophus sp. (in: bacteria)]
MLTVRETKEGVSFAIRVLPRSSKCELAGLQGDALKIRITEPAVEGRANEACIRFLASLFHVNKNRIAIEAGYKSRNKQISISGLTCGAIRAVLAEDLRQRQ